MVRIPSADGTSKAFGVLPRSKNTSSGPGGRRSSQQPSSHSSSSNDDTADGRHSTKLLCKHCNIYPKGFRGEHELQRHISLRHEPMRRVWICVDASENKQFLSDCKHCREGKQYGAYYNAAAHIRRVHFDPRKRGRKPKNVTERRGGKAGGKLPPMHELKAKWLREIEVVNEDYRPAGSKTKDKSIPIMTAAKVEKKIKNEVATKVDDDDRDVDFNFNDIPISTFTAESFHDGTPWF